MYIQYFLLSEYMYSTVDPSMNHVITCENCNDIMITSEFGSSLKYSFLFEYGSAIIHVHSHQVRK